MADVPSSPPAIYLNLLILESSLRSQYLHLLSRRRLNMFFMLLLSIWNLAFAWAFFLRPREDGHGHGGSVYWMVEAFQRVALMGGVVAALLIWATGQWERGVRWPRKWLATTNRGLREFNLRVVVVKRRWYRELLGHLAFLLPLGLLWSDDTGGFEDWHLVENEATGHVVEDDLAVGGDHIILLLQPKAFGPAFREAWEDYRAAYWERENSRRAALRRQLYILHRKRAHDLGGWKCADTAQTERVRRGSSVSSINSAAGSLRRKKRDTTLGLSMTSAGPGGGGEVAPERPRRKTASVTHL
ncbi:hypothetical protein DV735_g459, partial [Chaetothyriales sp. CBS 134920]